LDAHIRCRTPAATTQPLGTSMPKKKKRTIKPMQKQGEPKKQNFKT